MQKGHKMIRIETIPHKDQRYNTVGDWQFIGDDLIVRVSDMESEQGLYEFLVGIHELIEAVLCKAYGISQEEVDKFDMEHLDFEGEPGNLPDAPYYRQHLLATVIERILSDELDIDYNEYEEAIENL